MERTLGDYEIHVAREGFSSIRHRPSGEIMHSRTPPMDEARSLYVEQSRLGDRLRAGAVTLWDVGLGAAANAMAAIECHRELGAAAKPLRVVSFENDMDSLRLALGNSAAFLYLQHVAPREILDRGTWSGGGVKWDLVFGDFEETVVVADGPPDVVFYDMYSGATVPGPWSLETLRRLRERCTGHATELFTYTVSTAVRAKMLAAGWFVARGRNAGAKLETTIALTPEAVRDSHRDLLGPEWLSKWGRSAARIPGEISVEERAEFERAVREHLQFTAPPCPTQTVSVPS